MSDLIKDMSGVNSVVFIASRADSTFPDQADTQSMYFGRGMVAIVATAILIYILFWPK